MVAGNADDFSWEGLACPPLEDYAFNFDTATCTLDDLMLDDPLLEDDLLDNQEIDAKANVGTYGGGKELMTSRQVVQVEKQRDITSLDHTNQCAMSKKRKSDYGSNPVQVKNTRGSVHANQTAGGQNWTIVDYESKFEASRRMLHKAYGEVREVKERRHIQIIDFQKPEAQQPGSKAKAKGKASLRQKLMVMGTRKSTKKFPPYKMLSSCNQ